MVYQALSYMKFLRQAKNKHGVHSPFVYKLVTECFNDRQQKLDYRILRQHKKALKKDKTLLEVTDFGAGSRIFTSNKRMVKAIAKRAGIPKKRQRLLYRMVTYFHPKTILELGTSLGKSTLSMALAAPGSIIDTVEGCPETAKTAASYFKEFEIENINIHNQPFQEFLQQYSEETIDFAFIDGGHNKDQTLGIFQELVNKTHNDSILIFDDIYWSREMTAAWKEIIGHPSVTVSIDTYQWGMVFFRKEQRKQHFTIRL
jgi:predicted O-methyltransferase YrrM